jgi:transposase-like protein
LGRERFWRRLLRLWRRSGRTVRAFCGEHQVSEPSFFAWRRTLAERDRQRGRRGKLRAKAGGDGDRPATAGGPSRGPTAQADPKPAFVPLRVVTAAVFEVVLHGGRVVRVPAHFDAASLRQLLAILEEERPC